MIRIPTTFLHPLFFQEEEQVDIFEKEFPLAMKEFYFYYDITEIDRPWERIEETIPIVLTQWDNLKQTIHQAFENRQRKKAKQPMVIGLSYMICALHWLNGKKVCSLLLEEKLSIAPINYKERLQFIVERCDMYPSFVQLSQLFEELEKNFYKQLTMKNK